MSLRSSGLWCDVCNKPFLTEILTGETVQSFKVAASNNTLHTHKVCSELIEPACNAQDETLLPAGSPLGDLIRRVKVHNAKIDSQTNLAGRSSGKSSQGTRLQAEDCERRV